MGCMTKGLGLCSEVLIKALFNFKSIWFRCYKNRGGVVSRKYMSYKMKNMLCINALKCFLCNQCILFQDGNLKQDLTRLSSSIHFQCLGTCIVFLTMCGVAFLLISMATFSPHISGIGGKVLHGSYHNFQEGLDPGLFHFTN